VYVPSLRWRQGEYQALHRLSKEVKDRVVPFITVPPIEFDFEEGREKKSIYDHVQPFASRYEGKWGQRPAWITLDASIVSQGMADGQSVFTYVFDELRARNSNAIPAVPLSSDSDVIKAVATIVERDGKGAAISLQLVDLMKPKPDERLARLVSELGVNLSDVDIAVDLGAPNFEPYEDFSRVLSTALERIGDLNVFRNLVVIGTAIPERLSGYAKWGDEEVRHDWLFYEALTKQLSTGTRQPNYGDYTVVHPSFTVMDMRKIKPSGKVVYTGPHKWAIHKGGAFRDDPAQMHDHCSAILASGTFYGPTYSFGDDFIAECAARRKGPSNLTMWKQVAINHHITVVVRQLAKHGAS